MAVQRFSANWNQRTDLMDQITPNVEYVSDHKIIPGGEFKPAPWLPIVWTDTRSQDAFVISKGKVVALDTQGDVVPAGLRTKLQSGLVYTATDVAYGVTDLTTGEVVAAAVSYSGLEVARALVARGLVLEQNFSGVPDEPTTIPAFISMPIGISNCDVYVWAGAEGETTFTNYRKQHLVTFMTQCNLVVPQMSADLVSVGGSFDATTLVTTVFNNSTEPFPDAGQLWNITNLLLVARYANVLDSTSPVVALGLGTEQSIARITDRTPLTTDVTSVDLLLRERPSADLITRAGDFFLDAEVGVLFLHSTTWAALVTAAETDIDFSYYVYPVTSPTTATLERNIYFVGQVLPGDCIGVDADSNFVVVPLSTTINTLDDVRGVIGRVTGVLVEPQGLLESVKTGWNFNGADSKIQMPGTATKGFSDRITFMDEVVADKLIIVFIDCK